MAKPTKLNIIISRDRAEMAERVAMTMGAHILENPKANIGVTVGATPVLAYRQLASFSVRGVVDLSKTHFIVWDEFYQSPQSQRDHPLPLTPHLTELNKTLFSQAKLRREQILSPSGELSVDQALDSFSELVHVRQPNLLILNLGPEGNFGFLFNKNGRTPNPHKVDISSHAKETNHGYDTCLSLGYEQILQADEVLILGVARNKASLVSKIVNDSTQSTVAGWVLHNHPRAKLFVDAKAAAEISSISKAPSYLKGFRIMDDPSAISGQKIICFSPHPDDTSISAGATLSFFSQNNDVVSCCATTGHRAFIPDTDQAQRIRIREEEASLEAKLLGAAAHFLRLPLYDRGSVSGPDDIEIMMNYLQTQKPAVIFLPHTGDAHPTHRAVVQTVLQALNQLLTLNKDLRYDIYMYEGPWSLFSGGSYNTIVSPTQDCFAQKISAIRAHKSQTGRTPYDVAGDALAQLRGALVPEQDLSGFGGAPPKLENRLELFFHRELLCPEDVQPLISLVIEGKPPSALQDDLRRSQSS